MQVSKECLKLIANYESNGKPHLKAIKSPEQPIKGEIKYEIGFGHNSDAFFQVTKDTVITEEQAYEILEHDVKEASDRVNRFIDKHGWFVEQNEFDAMVMAVFNGVALDNKNKASQTYNALVDYFDSDRAYECGEKLDHMWSKWVKARVNGELVTMQGLVKRRNDELEVFFNADYERSN